MDAVKFVEERRRMYTLGCIKKGINDYNTKAEDVVAEVEAWSALHPRKTRQSVFLEQYPEAEIDERGDLMLCPRRISDTRIVQRCVPTAAASSGCRRWSDGNFENCFPAADGSRCAGQFGGKYRQQGGLGYQFAMAGRVYPVYCADSAKYELMEGKE